MSDQSLSCIYLVCWRW